MSIRFLSMAALASTLSFALNCGVYESHGTNPDRSLTRTPHTTSSQEGSTQAVVKSVEFYTWWWNDEQLKGEFDERNPPPKKAYIKIEQWKDTSNANAPHPDQLDIVCQIENKGDKPTDFVVLVTGDWIVAPQSQYSDRDIDKITDEVAWTEETKISREVVHNLAPGERREVKIKDYNLRETLKNYSGARADTLWPWKFRVHVYIEKTDGTRIAQEQAVLSLIPRDAKAGS